VENVQLRRIHNIYLGVINMNKSRLVSIISKASNKYEDKLVDFMDKYNLYNLQSASGEQLQEYIEEKGLVEMKLDDRLQKLIKEEGEQVQREREKPLLQYSAAELKQELRRRKR